MTDSSARVWVGIDAGKAHHWAVAIDADGQVMLSRKVINDETEILQLITAICEATDEVSWAVDISGRASTLLLALLIGHGQSVVYIPGRTVNRMSAAYRGEGKTDAKDALVIADTCRRSVTPQLVEGFDADALMDRHDIELSSGRQRVRPARIVMPDLPAVFRNFGSGGDPRQSPPRHHLHPNAPRSHPHGAGRLPLLQGFDEGGGAADDDGGRGMTWVSPPDRHP